jgi:small subunit ribosomal protein S16
MAVVLRLRRMGAKKRPIYRIVAADSRCPRDGKYLEALGQYNPRKTEGQVTLDKESVSRWISTGAEVSSAVRNILKREGL